MKNQIQSIQQQGNKYKIFRKRGKNSKAKEEVTLLKNIFLKKTKLIEVYIHFGKLKAILIRF
jgi:hypothetical protein